MCSIIQWNIRGYRANFEEIKTFIRDYRPVSICLQETFHGDRPPFPPSGYAVYCAPPVVEMMPGTRPPRGVVTLVHRTVPHQVIPLQTDLEAVAIRIQMFRSITVCNLYLTPNEEVRQRDLLALIQELPEPFIITGDLNSRSPVWGDVLTCRRADMLLEVVRDTDLCILNTGSKTHVHKQTGTLTCVDLTLASSNIALDITWETHLDLCGSDHYPILLKEVNNEVQQGEARYKIEDADWRLFTVLTAINMREHEGKSVSEVEEVFRCLVIDAANAAIPQTAPKGRYHPIPWWNDECSKTQEDRKAAIRRYRRTRSLEDKVELNRRTAIARRVKRKAKAECWKSFVGSINASTPMSKVWKKMNKIKGKYKSSRRPCLRIDGEVVVEEARVAEAMGRHLEVVSSDQGYDQAFLQIKHTAEIRELNFNVRQHMEYNEPFTVMELKTALKSSSNTAPGEDKTSYPMLRHLSESALEFLLYMYNVIWRTGDFPGVWRDAVVLPFLKPGKDPTIPESYRPIALTSCVCKLMEKMVNGRLMHVLGKSNVISPYQYGFRKMRSCEDTLARVECDIRKAFKKGQYLVAVLFDIEKAYDEAWRYHVLQKVHKCNIRSSEKFYPKLLVS